jgi:hypothetical protein
MRQVLLTAAFLGLIGIPTAASAQIMSLEQAVVEVRRVNPQVRGALSLAVGKASDHSELYPHRSAVHFHRF